jgi:hypothetical protein
LVKGGWARTPGPMRRLAMENIKSVPAQEGLTSTDVIK